MISLKPMIRLVPIFSLVFITSCKDPVPTKPVDDQDSIPRFVLSASNHRLTSLDLRIQWLHFVPPVPVTVYSNDDSLTSFNQRTTDTTLTLTVLTPSTDYRLTVKSRLTPPTLATLATRTMDTTSHDFTWNTDTLGAPGTVLRDVVIVNDTCVWVVGELLPTDYPESWIYNAAMWNGKKWTKHRIETPSYPSGYMSAKPAWSILYVDGMLWITTDDGAYAYSNDLGNTWVTGRYPLGSGRGIFFKGWANSRSDMYWIGNNGSITHYDGQTFRLIESGTTYDLVDLYPDGDGKMWICGYNPKTNDAVILHQTSTGFQPVQWPFLNRFLAATSIYQVDQKYMFTQIESIFYKFPISDFTKIQAERKDGFIIDTKAFTNRTRGNGENDFISGGVRGTMWHYNGSTWQNYPELYFPYRLIRSLDYKSKRVVGVGYDLDHHEQGFVLFGERKEGTGKTRIRVTP